MSEEKSYDLKKSVEGLGQLYPILLDAHGNVIDGFHRKEIDPKWPTITLSHIDSTVKLEAARLAANFNRRNVPAEELRQKIGFLVGAGLKAPEIAALTGLSERTVYRYMPEAFKDKVKVDAGKAKSEVARDVVTAVSRLVECECCGMGTREPKPFGKYDVLCPSCYLKAVKYPRLFRREPTAKPKPEVKVYKETPEFKRARMHPSVSKMELAVLEELHKRGHKVEFQKEVCLEKTVVDFIVDGKPVYLDGKRVHRNREWTDERIRERLAKKYGQPVYAVAYERFSKENRGQLTDSIEEAL